MWFEPDGSLVMETLYDTVPDAREAARTFLVGIGNSVWDVDVALESATIDRGWWSATYGGFTHDCSQHPPEDSSPATCFPDTVPVTVVSGLPPDLQRYIPESS
jgi:hypothetical protein